MRFKTLAEWLAWQEGLHPAEIELGLERCRRVAELLAWPERRFPIISVAGTNGKGSCVAMLESILRVGGYRTGAYTSPHLVRYNERIRIDGREANDDELCIAFERVDRARGDTTLTYFEFGTLAAMECFRRENLDVVILEVGLGGRLDAVNLFDSDASLICSVAVDHVEWLGEEREDIGREKAGIFRSGRPAVCGDPDPPNSVEAYATEIGAPLYRRGREFDLEITGDEWCWFSGERRMEGLPIPGLLGRFQLDNAAAVIMLLNALAGRLPLTQESLHRGLTAASLTGHLQSIPGEVELILDVAHNPEAAGALAAWLNEHPVSGATYALFGAMSDKDLEGIIRPLAPLLDSWHLTNLDSTRSADQRELAELLRKVAVGREMALHDDLRSAYVAAKRGAAPGDRIVVFGSFLTVSGVMECLEDR